MKSVKRSVDIKQLEEGMILAETIFDIDGKVLFNEGLGLSNKRIERIQSLQIEQCLVEDRVAYNVHKNTNQETTSIFEKKAAYRKAVILNETRQEASEVVSEILEKVLDGNSMKADRIKKIVGKIIDVVLMDDRVVLNLSNMNAIDNYLLSHSVNVCVLSLITGIYYGLTQKKLMQLGIGALIHDIGKMLIPQDIYHKPEKLTDEEYEIVKNHTVYGHKIMRDNLNLENDTANIALWHHERVDGLGYPHGLNKYDIPIFAKIVGIADVFDAITSDRIYCKRIDYYQGVSYLIDYADIQFDIEIVKKFIIMIGYYPIGLFIQLNTGDIGQVMTKNKLCPVVRITQDSNGERLSNYYEIDLYKNPSISIVDINIEEFKLRRASK